ncbi:uncharacterized protein LOC110806313 [Carica papaya]|uniref:uncharacterized protein LOC110806313 n=1 Tax=Carica papaya TaxID=3649 RepID=UPI000B8CB1B0|nr:uncharacterized protein LOC110806313 [Carica papaya]XP_021886825.1 uncharacterized protein LOC110806313 [Carica papaya]
MKLRICPQKFVLLQLCLSGFLILGMETMSFEVASRMFNLEKTNWVLHQLHLGKEEEEKDDEHVVSKIFYQQQKQNEKTDESIIREDADTYTIRTSPRTPKPNPPDPPRPGDFMAYDDVFDEILLHSSAQRLEDVEEVFKVCNEEYVGYSSWLGSESQALESSNTIDDVRRFSILLYLIMA